LEQLIFEMTTSAKKYERKILKLLPYDDPLLRVQSNTVTFSLPLLDVYLINDMLYSVEAPQLAAAKAPWPSAAGMAAPQWGVSRRIFVIQRQYLKEVVQLSKSDCHLEGSDGFVVVINPEYEGVSQKEGVDDNIDNNKDLKHNEGHISTTSLEEIEDVEGCFSIPGKRGRVRRYNAVRAKFSTKSGIEHSIVLKGWAARVFQHETDHTEGRLYDDPGANRCRQLTTISEQC
jgi:peptide deformylase